MEKLSYAQEREHSKKVLTEFEKHAISYALLRNYEWLYSSGTPTGFDTLVAQQDMPRLHVLLLSLGFTQRTQQFSLRHKAYFKVTEGNDISFKISFDIQVGGIFWNDMKYLDESVLKRRKKQQFFFTLSDTDALVMYIAHSMLGKRYFKQKYLNLIASLRATADMKDAMDKLSAIFGKRTAERLVSDDLSKATALPVVLRFIARNIGRNPMRAAEMAALFFRWVKWKRFVGVAPLISIVGPDGAGKTSLAEHIAVYLKNTERRISVTYTGRGRGHLLPISRAGYLYKKNEQKNEKKRQKMHEGKQNTAESVKLLYVIALPVFAIDLMLRYLFLIFPQRLRKKIVITDRYATDILLMKHVPMWMKKCAVFLFPKPTISVLLYNDAALLHQRRTEEPVEELQRQLDILKKGKYTMCVQTTDKEKDTQRVIDAVMTELLRTWW